MSAAPRTKVRTHVYHNADGTVFGEKTKWSDGNYTWMRNGQSGLDGEKAPLYHLDTIQGKTFVFIPEGERDVESLEALGLRATCNPNGAAEKIEDRHIQQLLDAGVKKVAVLYDNDKPGIAHGHDWAQQCQQAGINTRLVSLPNEVAPAPKSHGTDVTDWIAGGGTKEALWTLATEASPYSPAMTSPKTPTPKTPIPKPAPAEEGKPTIIVSISGKHDKNDLHTETFDTVVMLNRTDPHVFQRSMYLTRVRPDDDGYPVIETFSEPAFAGYLAHAIRWMTVSMEMEGSSPAEGTEEKKPKMKLALRSINPPASVIKNILNRPEWAGIHVLRSIAQTPVFLKDGTLVTTPGYNADAQLWYQPPTDFEVVVPDEPTELEVAMACDLLLGMIVDFPFDSDASRAHALAYFLLPFCRLMIQGPTPLHVFDAPTQGAGKGLLVELGSIMATGTQAPMVTVPDRDENELRKRITSQLLGGSPSIILDNIVHPLRSAAVAGALIAKYWGDRTLGISKIERKLENRAVWVATGNNVELGRDIARRAVFCRLEPQQEDPWLRTGFKEPKLMEWASAHRGELVSAALTLIRGWIVAGRPAFKHPQIGSFEAWADTLAGVLGHAGVKGFLENFKATAAAVDPELEGWREFVLSWWEQHEEKPVLALELVELAHKHILRKDGDAGELGKMLSKVKGRVIVGCRIEKAKSTRRGVPWRLVRVVSLTPNAYELPDEWGHEDQAVEAPSGNSKVPEVRLTTLTDHEEGSEESRGDKLNREWRERPRES